MSCVHERELSSGLEVELLLQMGRGWSGADVCGTVDCGAPGDLPESQALPLAEVRSGDLLGTHGSTLRLVVFCTSTKQEHPFRRERAGEKCCAL